MEKKGLKTFGAQRWWSGDKTFELSIMFSFDARLISCFAESESAQHRGQNCSDCSFDIDGKTFELKIELVLWHPTWIQNNGKTFEWLVMMDR